MHVFEVLGSSLRGKHQATPLPWSSGVRAHKRITTPTSVGFREPVCIHPARTHIVSICNASTSPSPGSEPSLICSAPREADGRAPRLGGLRGSFLLERMLRAASH